MFKLPGLEGASVVREAFAKRKAPRKAHHRLRPPNEVLEEVCELCQVDLSELMRVEMGPHANPARRFAIWALNRSSKGSQREIGELLKVRYAQVSRLVARLRKQKPTDEVGAWMNEWLRREEVNVSSGGT